jgi:hypothetical protein
MDTSIQSHRVNVSANSGKAVNVEAGANSISPFWEKMEFNRFAITPMILAFMACMAGITIAYGATGSDLQLLLTIFSNGFILIGILGLLPMRFIIPWSILAFVIDVFILLF